VTQTEGDDDNVLDGYAVEHEVRQVVARLGVADFVYRAALVSKGGATREPGDALLIANGRGAILQVKARFAQGDSDLPQRITKRLQKAYDQGRGTRREIARRRDSGTPASATPLRAADLDESDRAAMTLRLDEAVESWPVIIIVDSPHVDGLQPPEHSDAFWITTDDWQMLNAALRSVTGLLVYVERVLAHGDVSAVPLGHEAGRFHQIVAADATYAAAGEATSRPWLDTSALDDPLGADLYRQLLEGLWPAGQPAPSAPPEHVRAILEFLDGVPPAFQVDCGRWLLTKRRLLSKGPWASGVQLIDGRRLFVFACTTTSHVADDVGMFEALVTNLASVRLDEAAAQDPGYTEGLAVGNLVADDGSVGYFYALLWEPPGSSQEGRSLVLHQHGRLDLGQAAVVPLNAGRNDPCPCGSGQKFKRCLP
jgi:hypothetical protein